MVRLLLILTLLIVGAAQARTVTDGAGRRVEVPEQVRRVFLAGPPAQVLVYVLAPHTMLGWTRALTAEERPYIAPSYRDLPSTGRLAGRGSTASIEAILALKPDLILDVGATDATYASLADRVQAQTGIPYVLLDGRFDRTPVLLREAGALLGVPERGERLAAYAEALQSGVAQAVSATPAEHRPRVYLARGPDGLQTGLAGSINTEVLEWLGVRNVAAEAGPGGITGVSLEQVLKWNPAVIVTQDRHFAATVRNDPLWQGVAAVRAGRVLMAPAVPFGWIDAPPGVNRLIGVRWLAGQFYPQAFAGNMRAATREFYALFYGVDLSESDLNRLLNP